LDRYVESLHEPREPDNFWHPSSISTCLRQALYAFRGIPVSDPTPPRNKRVLRVGHLLHEFVQAAIAADPTVATFYAEVKITSDTLVVTGSTDGLLEYDDGTWELLEFKSISSRGFDYGDLPKADHVRQIVPYMKVLREEGGKAIDRGYAPVTIPPLGDKLHQARIIYVSKDDLRIGEHIVFYTPGKDAELMERLTELTQHQAAGTLPERLPDTVDKKGNHKRHWLCASYCSYRSLCWDYEGDPE
jgi:hypothetical protein